MYKPGRVNSNADALSRNPIIPSHASDSQLNLSLTDEIHNSCSRRLEEVLVCADELSIADSEVDRKDDAFHEYNNEVVVASVFLARGKAEVRENAVIGELLRNFNVNKDNTDCEGSLQLDTMDQLSFGDLLDGETESPATASDSVGSGPCSVKVLALCPAPEETSQDLQYLESWQGRGESVSFPAYAVVEALMPEIYSTNVVAEGCWA